MTLFIMVCSICKKIGHNKKSCLEKKEVENASNVTFTMVSLADYHKEQRTLKPSSFDGYWIYHGCDPTVDNKGEKILGKWMLFFKKELIDNKWEYFKSLFDKKLLKGVICMKVSASKENSRASSKNESVIILYCGGNEIEIMQTGKNIASYIQDYAGPYIYYKTDVQTGLGTKATGANINSTYKVPIINKCLIED